MLSERDLSAAIGSTVQGPEGEKIGTVESFFVDDRTGAPTWVAVSTGLFGTKHSIVPATQATFDDGVLSVPVHKDAVRHAPVMGGDHLGPEEEAALREHYGLTRGMAGTPGAGTGAGPDAGVQAPGVAGVDRRDTAVRDEPPAAGTPARGGAPVGGAPDGGAPVGGAPVGGAGVGGAPVRGAAVSGAATSGASAPGADTPVTDPGTRPVPAPAATARTTTEQAAAPLPPEHAARHAASTDGAMTRSEEQLRVGTEQVAATRVRLVKYVVTEEVQVTVPLRREEIRVEHVPLDAPDVPGESLAPAGGQAQPGTAQPGTAQLGTAQPGTAQPGTLPGGAPGGTGLGGLPEEIVLHAERPVVSVEVVPVERVRLGTEVVQGQERVTEQVQREQIVVDQTRSPQR